jgi:hypothetical protein
MFLGIPRRPMLRIVRSIGMTKMENVNGRALGFEPGLATIVRQHDGA